MDVSGRFDRFLEKVDYLLAASMWDRQDKIGFTVEFKADEGGKMNTQGPSDEELEVVLLRLRPFLLEDSPVNIFSVHNLCEQAIRDDELRGLLRQARAVWSTERKAGPLKVVLGERHLKPLDIADLFLNGRYFHDDETKKAELGALPGMIAGLAKYLFLEFVVEATRQAGYMASVIREARSRAALDEAPPAS